MIGEVADLSEKDQLTIDIEYLKSVGECCRCSFCEWSRLHSCTGRSCNEAIMSTANYVRQQRGIER